MEIETHLCRFRKESHMSENIPWGLDNPHLFSQMKMELIW